MKTDLVEELAWRGLIHDITPGTKEHLSQTPRSAYIGFDPTADSLHVGSLVPIILLMHLQRFGHKPIALVGGATGMIGDPTGKAKERTLLTKEILNSYVSGIQKQLERFLDFDEKNPAAARLVNNYDWMQNFSFINFARDVGKHITVNYMMAKDSVKKRLSSDSTQGMSFTEFTYQLLQGYDFFHLYKTMDCSLQMGGSDQWGNITTGVELIRRMLSKPAFALTCPLTTKQDGSKFGKSEGENIWLDPKKTSPYAFYQFWINTSDADAEKLIKIYTFLDQKSIIEIIETHKNAPEKRFLQQALAKEVTSWVHGKEAFEKAISATQILFGSATSNALKQLDENTFLSLFEGVAKTNLSLQNLKEGLPIVDAFFDKGKFIASKAETRRALKENALSVNKEKVDETRILSEVDLINQKYILLQRGKKNYYVLVFDAV